MAGPFSIRQGRIVSEDGETAFVALCFAVE